MFKCYAGLFTLMQGHLLKSCFQCNSSLISFVRVFLAWLYRILSPLLQAFSLVQQSLSFAVNHVVVICVEGFFWHVHILTETDVTVSVRSSRFVAGALKTL